MTKLYALLLWLFVLSFITACDPQSGMTKKGLEKYNPSPTPEIKKQVEEPIDPADVINVETAEPGPTIIVNRATGKKPVNCAKYNNVTVNGDGYEVNIKGVCKQLMVNGDKNKIVAVAISEIILNGVANSVEYSKYANGKKPFVTENAPGNTIEKAAPPENGNRRPRISRGSILKARTFLYSALVGPQASRLHEHEVRKRPEDVYNAGILGSRRLHSAASGTLAV